MRRLVRARLGLAVVAAAGPLLALAACSAPGPSPKTSSDLSGTVSTTLPKGNVTLDVTLQTQTFQTALFAEFHKQHPNISFNITQEEYNNLANELPRLLSASTTPDLIRAPSLGSLVKDRLVLSLDAYAKAYGWNDYPPTVLQQMRQTPDGGESGTGSLYENAVGGYGLVGVFYNKSLAARLGMRTPPATLADFEAVLAKAKTAGITPIEQPAGNYLYPFQSLAYQYENATTLNNWVFDKPGATFNTPGLVAAATEFQKWGQAGYFPSDAATLTLDDIFTRMKDGQGLFVFDGDFDGSLYQAQLPDNVGFMTIPALTAGSAGVSVIAPLTFIIPARAKYANVAAYFMNWVNTNPAARAITLDQGGSYPGGPTDLPLPPVAGNSVTAQTLPAAVKVLKSNAIGTYLSNATSGIFTTTFVPQLELLAAGKISPTTFVKTVQSAYTQQLNG